MALPTYDEAMSFVEGLLAAPETGSKRDYALKVVAPYIQFDTLTSCLRVCKKWNRILTPELWADPFGAMAYMERPFSQAVEFRDAAFEASPFTRSQLTTLNANKFLELQYIAAHRSDWFQHDGIFGISWFVSFMHLFPNLRFVLLDNVQGYSQMMLTDGYDQFLVEAVQKKNTESIYKPIVLSATYCQSQDWSYAMVCAPFSNLWCLDLSYSKWQEGWGPNFASTPLHNLRVLKLRGSRLTDNHFAYMLGADLDHLWCLDIRDNLFTDQILPHLNRRLLSRVPRTQSSVLDQNDNQQLYEATPAYSEASQETEDQLTLIRPATAEAFIEYLQDHGKFSCPDTEFLNENDPLSKKTGLTQLYLSGNQFSHQNLKALITGNNRLQVFDCGTVRQIKDNRVVMGQPRAGLALRRTTGTLLQGVRMHHSIVTYCMTTHGYESNANTWSPAYLEVDEAVGKEASSSHEAFSPPDNHRITNLVLTGIPTHSHGFIVQRLIEFLRQCLKQEELIKKANAEPRNRFSPTILPGLQSLTLEFIPQGKTTERPGSCGAGSSVSGDKDADNFQAESKKDFSFFSSFSSGTSGISTPLTQGKQFATVVQKKAVIPKDVVAELKAFRARELKWGGKLQLIVPQHDTLSNVNETIISG